MNPEDMNGDFLKPVTLANDILEDYLSNMYKSNDHRIKHFENFQVAFIEQSICVLYQNKTFLNFQRMNLIQKS